MLVTSFSAVLLDAPGIAQHLQEQDQQLCVQLGQDVGCQGRTHAACMFKSRAVFP